MTALHSAPYTEPAMKKLAAKIGAELKAGDVLAFYGELGAGKSTFARALVNALTGETNIPSPTFTLVQHYDAPAALLWHFDLYRLKQPEEVYELGWEDAGHTIRLIEWPERLGGLLPNSCLAIQLEFHQHSAKRLVTFKGNAEWARRLSFLQTPLPPVSTVS